MPAPQLFLRDYGYDGLQTPVNLAQVGLTTDVKLRGLIPVLGGQALVVTESGAHLYDLSATTLVDRVRITNNSPSRLVPFAELGETWSSEICSVPIPHYNVNRRATGGRSDKYAFGFLVVRRTDEVIGPDSRNFAHWNIHFDPPDLSAPGPVVGEFHFLKASSLDGDDFELQEVTFLDGCSTNAHIYRHEDGYSDLMPNLGGATGNEKSRLWDSYVVLRVLIETETQFWDWSTVDRSSLLPVPQAKSAYLIFTNGASEGAPGPPMKLIRIHYPGSLADVGDPIADLDLLAGQTGSRFLDAVQRVKLPQDLPWVPTKPLGGRNFLYTNPDPTQFATDVFLEDRSPGVKDTPWLRATGNEVSSALPQHEVWPEAIWQTSDDAGRDWSREPIQNISFPDRMTQSRFNEVEEWVPETPTGRTDALGSMGSHKFVDVEEVLDGWVPGWFAGIEIDDGIWVDNVSLPQAPTEERLLENRPGLYKRFLLTMRAIVAPDDSFVHHKVFAESLIGLVNPNFASFRIPQVNVNPVRGFEDPRYLYWATESNGEGLIHKAVIPVLTSYGPFQPAQIPAGFVDAFSFADVQTGGR